MYLRIPNTMKYKNHETLQKKKQSKHKYIKSYKNTLIDMKENKMISCLKWVCNSKKVFENNSSIR